MKQLLSSFLFLIIFCVDISAMENRDSLSKSLTLAIKQRNDKEIERHFEHVDGQILTVKDQYGWTPLLAAVAVQNLALVEHIVTKLRQAGTIMGVLVDVSDRACGMSPIHMAASRGNVSILGTLLAFTKTEDKQTLVNLETGRIICDDREISFCRRPLHFAKKKEVVQLLLECGAHIDVRDFIGRQPLHSVVTYEDVDKEVIAILVKSGAHVRSIDNSGMMPVQLAKNVKIRKVLLEQDRTGAIGNFLHDIKSRLAFFSFIAVACSYLYPTISCLFTCLRQCQSTD